ncbi:MAG: cystathionine gamma-synthase [Proteobacteria bacterium]|nr:cystathionine gamma-synthase [Pseudomonadota bacterium]
MRKKSLPTRTVRAGLETDAEHGAVVAPIYLSSTFTFAGLNERRRYDYSRSGNPTRDALAAALADLEGGAGAVVTATGMAAVTLAVVLARPGERIVAPHDCYGGTYRLLAALHRTGRAIVDFLDMTDAAALARALARRPRVVWIESPSNPLLRITDIAAVSAAAHEAGALVAVDNTFLSPGWQQPIALGADLVVHSTTKYINGHSDVVGGAVVSRDEGLHQELAWWGNCLGITGSAFDAFLTLRGLRTLHARLRQHGENAAAVAQLLESHGSVARVFYPGLERDPGHALAARQQSGFGAIVSFELAGGLPAVARFLDGLECFSLAESLGGVESLVAHPDTMTHAAMEPEARRQAGITPGLLRLSVGIEAAEDLLEDLGRGLDRAAA